MNQTSSTDTSHSLTSHSESKLESTAVQTTGHAWDGDIQEFNNPLPRWWLWAFYGTVIFAVIYWFIYPSWPVGSGWTRGMASITYTLEGQSYQSSWNTRAKLLDDLQTSTPAIRQQAYMDKIRQIKIDTILHDPEMLAFIRSVGKSLFGDNCAGCHGRGGQGVTGLYPNLVDDDWLWGGTPEKIEETLIGGRNGFMPAFREVLSPGQLDAVAEYVLTLSGEAPMSVDSEYGRTIFQGYEGGCYYCHGYNGKGLISQGAANLTDKIWTIADVPSQKTLADKKAVVSTFIANGVLNNRRMPGWKERLTDSEIRVLALYVHQLGGGQ